jgi:hypothetical protein
MELSVGWAPEGHILVYGIVVVAAASLHLDIACGPQVGDDRCCRPLRQAEGSGDGAHSVVRVGSNV